MPPLSLDNEIILLIEEIRTEQNVDKKKSLVKRLRELMNKKKNKITSKRILRRKEIKLPIAEQVRSVIDKSKSFSNIDASGYNKVISSSKVKLENLNKELKSAKASQNMQQVDEITRNISTEKAVIDMMKINEKDKIPLDRSVDELRSLLEINQDKNISARQKLKEFIVKVDQNVAGRTAESRKRMISSAITRYDPSYKGSIDKGKKKQFFDELIQEIGLEFFPEQSGSEMGDEMKQEQEQEFKSDDEIPQLINVPKVPQLPLQPYINWSEDDETSPISASVKKGLGKYKGGASVSDYLSTFSNIPGFSQAMGMLPIVGPMASVFGALGQTGSKVASNAMRGKGVQQMKGCGVPGIGDLASMVGQDLNSAFNVFKDFKGMIGLGRRRDIKSVSHNDYIKNLYNMADVKKLKEMVNMKNIENFNNQVLAKENAEQQNAVYQLLYNKLLSERQDKNLQEEVIKNQQSNKKKRILL